MNEPNPRLLNHLASIGLHNTGHILCNLSTPALYEEAIRRYEGLLSHLGPLVVRTGQYTGRLPNDKFIVREPSSQDRIWWGKVNREFAPEKFEIVRSRLCAYLQGKDLFTEDCYAGADPEYRLPIRIITERASAALFTRNMFIREFDPKKLHQHEPQFTILHAPGFRADPEIDGTHSEAFILLNFGKRLVLIGGTAYAGEIKKSVFTLMNYELPLRQVMAMHCSANYGRDEDDVAIFFGLSGTGKTTLSASPDRTLIGDDEHGWNEHGVFNFEGGCYAKTIRLSPESEPEIYETTRRFGTLLENVTIDIKTRRLDLNDASLTENTRAAYPITHIPNMSRRGMAGHPRNIIMLTCDAFGVLPPVARLTPDQAMYHFLSGYTAKVAGTEAGVKEPQATFSTCFGAPFMALPPSVYSGLLGEKINRHQVDVWLVNTGWAGGSYGEGRRMPLAVTRALVRAILSGELAAAETRLIQPFQLRVPLSCRDVPPEILDPRSAWKDLKAYESKAHELALMFQRNFQQSGFDTTDAVRAAGPVV
jgi:phosphoenolpyruvate carboxykinase (ATP)